LDAAYLSADILQLRRDPENVAAATFNSSAASLNCDSDRLVSRYTSEARVMRWFDRQDSAPPVWRNQWLAADQSDGAWCG
jgi:hypothetical protein